MPTMQSRAMSFVMNDVWSLWQKQSILMLIDKEIQQKMTEIVMKISEYSAIPFTESISLNKMAKLSFNTYR